MAADEVLAQLVDDFDYVSDVAGDRWRVLTGKGKVSGDCEDFALALAFRLAGRSWWRFWWHVLSRRSVVWFCQVRATGIGHAVLHHRGAGFADNIYPEWAEETPHIRRYPVGPVRVLARLCLAVLLAWLARTLKRAKI